MCQQGSCRDHLYIELSVYTNLGTLFILSAIQRMHIKWAHMEICLVSLLYATPNTDG